VRVDPSVTVSELPRDDVAALRDYWSVSAAARRIDAPLIPMEPFEELLAERSDERATRKQRWIARDSDRPVGIAELALPILDNTDAAIMNLEVHPADRRRGIGRALLAVGIERMRAEGRTLELGHDATDEQLAALENDAKKVAAGYELVQWVGPCSDDIVDDIAMLQGRMSTDMPLGELDWEPEVWDRKRYREREELSSRLGRRRMSSAARHVSSGRVVAFSDLGWSSQDESTAFQWMTIVAPQHRGRRLGMLIKAANLRALHREVPHLGRVITWNAESNVHIVAVKEAIGFLPRLRFSQWQLKLPR
jgi:GNAT superfamily N-acetyltransferase